MIETPKVGGPHARQFAKNASQTCSLKRDAHIAPLRAHQIAGHLAVKRFPVASVFYRYRNRSKALRNDSIFLL